MKTKLLFILGCLLVCLTACGESDSTAATAVPTPTPAAEFVQPETELESATAVPTLTAVPFVPTFAETECPFDLPEGVPAGKVVCGYVTVPEDHRKPEGPTIQIAVAIIKDQSEARRPDPVLVLSGGPGQKTLQDAVAIAQILAPFHPQRDLILFDQRGVGHSQPSLNCPEFVDALLANLAESEPIRQAEASYQALMACRDRLVAEGYNLAAYTSWQNGADVEAIRTALGYEQINLYGGSYGSHLAQVVMRDHPEAIRSVIMDSVYPLETSLFVDVATSSAETIMHLLDACAQDAGCADAYPDLEETLFVIVDRLNAEPEPMTLTSPIDGQQYDALLTGDVVVQNLRTFLYDTMAIPLLPQTIFDVYHGDYELVTRLAGARLATFDRLSTGMEISVICTDDLIGKTPQDFIDSLAALPPELAGSATPETIREYGIFAICQGWPVTEADPWVKEPLISDLPTLVLSGEFDPVTPPRYAELAAAHLTNSYLYEFAGVGHNPVGSSSCARSMVADFLADPHTAPDASCMVDLTISFVVPTDYDVTVREPVYIEEYDVYSQIPQGWTQVEPGVFTSPDYTQILYIIAIGSELEEFIIENELTGPIQEIEVNGRIWVFYEFQPDNPEAIGIDAFTVTEDGTVYDIALITLTDQRAEMMATVQMPAIEAFAIGEAPSTTLPLEQSWIFYSYSSQTFQIRGIVPHAWTETAPGVFQRGDTAADPTTLIQKSYPDMTVDDLNTLLLPQLGLTELPEAAGMLETAEFTWNLYYLEIDVPGGPKMVVEFAQTELDSVTYMVLLQALAEDYEAESWRETVFMPVVEALARLSE